MKLYLVRHGESVYNSKNLFQPEDSVLSELGVKQAEYLSERLKNIKIDIFVSSNMPRAVQTAEIISKRIGIKVNYSDLLREVRRPSVYIGKHRDDPSLEEFKKEIAKHQDDPDWHLSNEENFFDLLRRTKRVLKYLESLNEENILAVSHGNFIRLMMGYMMLGDDLDANEYARIKRFLLTINTGLTICKKSEKGWRLLTWNDHSHLG